MLLAESLRTVISKKLQTHLPDRTKRLIVLASLSGYICDKTKFDKESIHKLNEVMSLSVNDNALVFPIQISKVIWKNKVSDIVLYPKPKISDPDSLVRQIIERIPLCFQYSTYQEMFEDIKKLLENEPMLSH